MITEKDRRNSKVKFYDFAREQGWPVLGRGFPSTTAIIDGKFTCVIIKRTKGQDLTAAQYRTCSNLQRAGIPFVVFHADSRTWEKPDLTALAIGVGQ